MKEGNMMSYEMYEDFKETGKDNQNRTIGKA